MERKTAILIFANSARQEILNKSLPGGETLYNNLTEHTLLTVQKTELKYFHYTEIHQQGKSFGDRLYNAIKSVFEKGYHHVITVGNDTPQLTSAEINTANTQLKLQKTVLGPSTDGGFYLLGIDVKSFLSIDKNQFIALPWMTSKLITSISELLSLNSLNSYRLSYLMDLDNKRDLITLTDFHYSTSSRILKILKALVVKAKSTMYYSFPAIKKFYSNIYYNKGSPVPTL